MYTLPVSYITSFNHAKLIPFTAARNLLDSDPTYKIQQYGIKTGTTVLRKHLFTQHPREWGSRCLHSKVPIRTAAAQAAVLKEVTGSERVFEIKNTNAPTPEKKPFTPEGFTDGIVSWILSDDQVCALLTSLKILLVECSTNF